MVKFWTVSVSASFFYTHLCYIMYPFEAILSSEPYRHGSHLTNLSSSIANNRYFFYNRVKGFWPAVPCAEPILYTYYFMHLMLIWLFISPYFAVNVYLCLDEHIYFLFYDNRLAKSLLQYKFYTNPKKCIELTTSA